MNPTKISRFSILIKKLYFLILNERFRFSIPKKIIISSFKVIGYYLVHTKSPLLDPIRLQLIGQTHPIQSNLEYDKRENEGRRREGGGKGKRGRRGGKEGEKGKRGRREGKEGGGRRKGRKEKKEGKRKKKKI